MIDVVGEAAARLQAHEARLLVVLVDEERRIIVNVNEESIRA